MKGTCQKGACPSGRTASARGRCTGCSSSQSPGPAGLGGDRLHGAGAHSHGSSSPALITEGCN